ncbi:hypothetical protein PHLCEN_2v10803 [Hermanssonia centrifuga]|uniref:F-box domain-containing protein n=1 Tax=Hermanssonia centrifuga TaxID=98765 RepID=A0A2R6NLS2_9APHY|nr:hypothetical protein PHLCEN_2v10803 [Hermanssonia centrifuga]
MSSLGGKNGERPSLVNLDILVVLMTSLTSLLDLIHVMRTCRAAYSAGVPVLLSGHPILISKPKQLASFCSFMLADGATRCRHLRHLEFMNMKEVQDPATVEAFLEVLKNSHNLANLTLQHSDAFLKTDERVTLAFSALKSVKQLTIRDVTTTSTTMLDEMQSQVANATISFKNSNGAESDPISLLKRSCPSLETLSLWLPDITSDDLESQNIYPNMKTLHLTNWLFIEIEPLIHAFPNLRDLSVSMQGFTDAGLEEPEDESRQINEDAQSRRQWESLDHVRGDVINIYLLALKCDIGVLDLEVNWEAEGEQIEAILADAHPTRFNFRFSDPYEGVLEGSNLQRTLEPASEAVTHLYVAVSDVEDHEQAIDAVFEPLEACTNLVLLAVSLRAYGQTHSESDIKYVQELDFKEMAQRAVDLVPSLEHIVFELSSRGPGRSYWKVQKDDEDDEDSFTLQELPDEVGCKLVEPDWN